MAFNPRSASAKTPGNQRWGEGEIKPGNADMVRSCLKKVVQRRVLPRENILIIILNVYGRLW